jgi:sterol desaturase/sphingolipid hydroxylase (fatty acid hydroxylase superfamily)
MLVGILFHIFCYDVWFYISHIALHTRALGWIHKIHHQTPYETLTYKDTHVCHWIEGIIQPLGYFIPIAIYGVDKTNFSVMAISAVYICARGLARHDHRCVKWMGNHHLLHHKYPNYNYGEFWIDILCNTMYPDKDAKI